MTDKIETPIQDPEIKIEKSVFASVMKLTSLILSFCAVVYGIRTRPVSDFIKYGLYIDGAILIIIALVFIVSTIKFGYRNQPKAEIRIAGLLLLPTLFFIPLIYYSISVSVKDLYFWILSPEHHNGFRMFSISVVTFYLGFTLFYIRYKARAIYGMSEAAVGVMVAAYKVSTFQESLISFNFIFVILIASVYLVVRGFDNIHQGLTKEPKDKRALKFFNYFLKVGEI
ncbi:MAG TPA: hypothetical protein VNX01_07075 [Bacteroidia bacterium]|jgi:hypothetical protein|nr:hypothetical protein [Bacteroidia bacterium]